MVSDSLVGPNRLIGVSRVLISFTFRFEEAGGRGKKRRKKEKKEREEEENNSRKQILYMTRLAQKRLLLL